MGVNSGEFPSEWLKSMAPVAVSGADPAAAVAQRTRIGPRALAVAGGMNSHQFVGELVKRGWRADAVKFIAAWLAPRDSLWFATLGVWQTYRLLGQTGAEESLRRVAAFVRVPTAANLAALGPARQVLRDAGTMGLLAQAALYSGDNISSGKGKAIKPAAHLTRKIAGSALIVAAAKWPGRHKAACLDQFVSMGLDIAEGLHLWAPNPQQKYPGLRQAPLHEIFSQKAGNIWDNWK